MVVIPAETPGRVSNAQAQGSQKCDFTSLFFENILQIYIHLLSFNFMFLFSFYQRYIKSWINWVDGV